MLVRRIFALSSLCLFLSSSAGIAFAAPLVGGNTYPINGVQNPPTSFGTIANAVTFLTSQGVSGSGQVVLQLVSGYPGDTAPIIIAPIPGVSATLGVTFRPGSGFTATTSIPANSTNHNAIEIWSSYVTLDGRAGGVGSTRSWTIRSTGVSPNQSGQAVWIVASGVREGIAVRYCILETQAGNHKPDVMRVDVEGIAGDQLSNCTIEQNLLRGFSGNVGFGMRLSGLGGALTVQNNVIEGVSWGGISYINQQIPFLLSGNTITSTLADVSQIDFHGIEVGTDQSPGARIEKNLIYVSGVTAGSNTVRGITVDAANQTGSPIRISNNRVVLNPSSPTNVTMWGISVEPNSDGALVDVDYNSVYVGGQVASGSTRNSAAFRRVGFDAGRTRNNIFYNARANTGSATGVHWAIAMDDPTLVSGAVIGHNDYFVSGTGGVLGTIDLLASGNKTTLAAWQAAVPGDAGSLSQNPNYQNATGNPPDLSLNPSAPTMLESHGIAIAGLDTDFQGDIRFGSGGYSGTGTAPDIGSDEGEFLLLQGNDMGVVAFVNPLAGGTKATGRTFTPQATFQNSGVNAQTNVPVRFRIAGPSPSNTIVYDQTATIASAPSGGAPIAVSFPATSLSPAGDYTMTIRAELVGDTYAPNDQLTGALTIIDPLAGAYTVGGAQAAPFNTLTAAVNRLNAVGVSAAVTFNLSDASYGASESFPISIGPVDGVSASNAVTIKPAAAVTTSLSGSSSTAILVLNGGDYIRLNGSNSGGSTRDWTVTNTSATTNTAVVWLQTTIGNDPTTNNIVSNLNVVGAGSSLTLVGIGSGSNTIGLNSNGLGNNNNSVQNCKVTRTQVGIYSAGGFPKNTGTVVQGNTLGAAGIDAVRDCGILLRYEDGASVTGNSIDQVGGSTQSAIGISLSFTPSTMFPDVMGTMNEVVNTLVSANQIKAVVTSGAPSPPAIGMAAHGGTVGGNRIVNNVVRGVISPAPSAGNITAGIYVMPGAGTSEVFFNSVAMTGARGSTTTPSLALALDGGIPFVDVRNNILYNTQTSTGTGRSYAIGLAGSSYGSLTSDRNVMFTSGTSARFAVVGGFTNTPGGDKTSLALWQSTTGKDANSVSADPRFVNPASDLHIQNTGLTVSPAAILAVPITGVTTDFEGDARPSNPDAGADEFVTYEMNATAVGPGTVAKNPNQPTYNPGVTVQLTATQNADGLFTGWTGDASGSTNPLSVVMNATKNIQAQFQQRGLTVLDTSGLEGTGIPGYATFHVLTDLAPSQPVSVTLRTFGGSAHSYGSSPDYDSTSVVLIFPAGVIDTQTVNVPMFSDPNFEPDETFRLAIVNAQGFGVADSSGTYTIQNDDSPPSIYCFDSTGPEGTGGTGLRVIQVNLTAFSYLPVQFKARTVDGTATVADNDYQAISPPQTFTIPQETQATSVFVTVVRDGNIEPNEYFDVVLSNPVNASIQDSTGRVTLQDDDTPTTFNIFDGQVVEGPGATIGLSVELSGPIPFGDITVQYQTFGGTATSGVDYTPVSPPQTITLAGGRGYATITLLDDTDPEGAETIQVRILNPSVGVLGDSIGVVTILDDDETTPPSVTLLTPNGGESWPVGTQQSVTWNASDNVGVQYVNIQLSADGGTTWQVIDQVLAVPSAYSWFVPNQPTGVALMRITAVDYAGNSAEDTGNGTFRIPSVVGVAEAPAIFFMHPAAPNPFVSATLLSYSLDRDGPVRVEVFDVVGRRRAVLVDEVENRGPHAARWDGRDERGASVPSGLYVIRLTFPGHVARERVLRIR